MGESRIFADVTADLLARIKQEAHDKHGILFDPAEGAAGTATGRTPLGDVIVRFEHDSAKAALVITLVKKPMMLPSALLWKAFGAELERIRGLV